MRHTAGAAASGDRLVAALFQVVMHAHRMAFAVMVFIRECLRSANKTDHRCRERQESLLHRESLQMGRGRHRIKAGLQFAKVGRIAGNTPPGGRLDGPQWSIQDYRVFSHNDLLK